MNNKFLPLISIVIPTYNHGNYLPRALQSILDQTYRNWEAIIIDNYSTDDTDKIIKAYVDPRIKYLKIRNYGVIAKSRNAGILKANGEWIAFLDSDDWWTKDKLEVCFKKINQDVDFIYHQMKIKSNKPTLFSRNKTNNKQLRKPILKDLLIGGNVISNSSVVVRKNLLEKIGYIDERKDLVAAEDYHSWMRIAKLTNNFFYIPQILGYYFQHDQSLSKKNMSIPYKNAVSEFKELLTKKENTSIEANIKYISGKFYYQINYYDKSKKELNYVLKYGHIYLKLRTLLMLLMMLFK